MRAGNPLKRRGCTYQSEHLRGGGTLDFVGGAHKSLRRTSCEYNYQRAKRYIEVLNTSRQGVIQRAVGALCYVLVL